VTQTDGERAPDEVGLCDGSERSREPNTSAPPPEAVTGNDGLLKLAWGRTRLVLANLPDMDGIELTRRIRAQSDAAVIVCSDRDDELSQILALDSDASDYITKPIRAATFLTRLRAVLRRSGSGAFAAGCLRADPVQSRVGVRGMEAVLTPTEFRLLNVLMHEPGRALRIGTYFGKFGDRCTRARFNTCAFIFGSSVKK
jgi:DNA-binding response OmpR family regulator